MKNLKIIAVFMIPALILCFAGCVNRHTFDTAVISLPNGEVVEGTVESWTEYAYSNQIQVKIDSVTYFVHSSDIVLIAND
jgi:hypothetical protein